MAINISNAKNRDAVVAAEGLAPKRDVRYVDKDGRPVINKKVLKSDVTHDLPELLKKRKELESVAKARGLSQYVHTEGPAIALNYVTRDREGQPSLPLRTLLAQELLKGGIMIPWIAVSQSHGPAELQMTLEAFDGALTVYGRALEDGVEGLLEGPAIRPVFRRYN